MSQLKEVKLQVCDSDLSFEAFLLELFLLPGLALPLALRVLRDLRRERRNGGVGHGSSYQIRFSIIKRKTDVLTPL